MHTTGNSSTALGGILVTDFDGTITDRDFFDLACHELLPPTAMEFWHLYCQDRITHFQALAGMFALIRGEESVVRAAVRKCRPDPELADCVGRLRRAGWELVVASAGCEWYIRQLLSEAGLSEADYTLHTNLGRYSPSEGLVMSQPVSSPFHWEPVGIDKAAVVRDALARSAGRPVIFAGDGRADVPALRLVPESRRFARAAAATLLSREGLAYRSFVRWSEVAAAALAESGQSP